MTNLNPAQAARLAMRRGEWIGPTKHTVPGYVKTNVVILPRVEAYDFLVFCHRNPQSCPLVEILDVGTQNQNMRHPGRIYARIYHAMLSTVLGNGKRIVQTLAICGSMTVCVFLLVQV